MKLGLTVGLPGSGKSTWLREQGLPALSSDAVRALLTGDETNQNINRLVFRTLRRLCEARLEAGMAETWIDSTALAQWERRCWIRWAELNGCDIECVFFDVPLDECLRRNAARDRIVPASAMQAMAARLVRPSIEEGFASVRVVQPGYTSSAII
jgi:predicted kinase